MTLCQLPFCQLPTFHPVGLISETEINRRSGRISWQHVDVFKRHVLILASGLDLGSPHPWPRPLTKPAAPTIYLDPNWYIFSLFLHRKFIGAQGGKVDNMLTFLIKGQRIRHLQGELSMPQRTISILLMPWRINWSFFDSPRPRQVEATPLYRVERGPVSKQRLFCAIYRVINMRYCSSTLRNCPPL
jgi:hypothetical protein